MEDTFPITLCVLQLRSKAECLARLYLKVTNPRFIILPNTVQMISYLLFKALQKVSCNLGKHKEKTYLFLRSNIQTAFSGIICIV